MCSLSYCQYPVYHIRYGYFVSAQLLAARLYWRDRRVETTVIRYKIREIAQSKGISQTRLGQLALLDMERMRRIWRDGTSDSANITLQVLDRIAKALGVDASELIESTPDK